MRSEAKAGKHKPRIAGLGHTAIHYIPQIAEQVANHGADVAVWLARAGLDESCLTTPGFELPSNAYAALLEDAVALTGDSGLGIRVGCQLPPSGHGIVGLATAAAASIIEAMEIVHTYVPLRTSLITIRPEVSHDCLRVIFETTPGLGQAGNIVSEIAVGTVKNIADSKVPNDSLCKQAVFTMKEPPHADLARELLGCDVDYGHSWTGMIFDITDAQRSFISRDALVMSEAIAVCQSELDRISSSRTMTALVERLLLNSKGTFLSQDACANQLNLSPRTLHRRLNEEGSSYRDVLDSVRRRLAQEYLKSQNLGVKETAYLLGYRDTANFRRAFTRWFGFPPSKL